MQNKIFVFLFCLLIGNVFFVVQGNALLVEPETIFSNYNVDAVFNNPASPTVFSISKSYFISEIETYHWNSARGKSPGQISLKHSDGTRYGPWNAEGRDGYLDVPNAYWRVEPNETIKAGTYTILDSDSATWSYNSASQNQGMAEVKGIASISQNNDLESHGVTVSGLKFFEAGDQAPALEQRQFLNSFSKDSARFIYYQLDLEHPNINERIDFTLTCRYYYPDGSLFGEFELDSYILESWKSSYHYYAYGWSSPGNWEPGTYTVQMLQNSKEIATGSFSIVEGSSIIDPKDWLTGFPVSVDESNVDDFYPVPEFPAKQSDLKRSYDPFGGGSDWFEGSTIRTGRGGLRITDLMLDDMSYWLDMQINLSDSSIPLQIIDFQAGDPVSPYPEWGYGNNFIDFRMSEADIFGPPPYFSFFDLGIDGLSYNIYFDFNGQDFALSDIEQSGYTHYLPNENSPEIGVVTSSPDPPVRSDQSKLCFSDLPYGVPLAIFNVNHPDGKDYLGIDYCSESRLQKFDIQDGVALGTYAPLSEQNIYYTKIKPRNLTRQGSLWFSSTIEQKLEQCIEDESSLTIGLQRDNKLGEALFELATSFAGELDLGSKSLNTAKDALSSNKDLIGDLISNGGVKPEDMSVFVLTTLLKNATPEEHKKFVDKFFDGNVPENVQTIVEGAGTAQERDYKTALLGITKKATENYFPVSSKLVKTVIEGQKWAIETMADDDVQNLYKKYKYNNGNWNDTYHTRSLFRSNHRLKIKQLLEKQGKSTSEANIESYLKNLFEKWYEQEKNAPDKKQELETIKDKYLDDVQVRDTIKRLLPDASECERLKFMLQHVNKSRMDLIQAMGPCDMKPSQQDIRETSILMARRMLRDSGTMADRKEAYQQVKLDFLEGWGCENYEEPARSEICNDVVKEGSNTPEVLNVELGKTSGTFQLTYETYSVKDRVVVAYENSIIFDSGCVGTDGEKSVSLSYSGQSSSVTIRVEPNCDGSPSTKWYFKVGCP